MIKKLFHKHTLSKSVFTADEVIGLKFHYAISLASGDTHHFERKPCPQHGMHRMRTDGKCESYGCSTDFKIVTMPKLSDIVITYEKCMYCDFYSINIQCGLYKYTANKEYIKIRLDELKKKKDDEETERLLNLGNPDFKPKVDYEKKMHEYDSIITAQRETINKLTINYRATVDRLNESRKNDDIWERIPEKVRKDLFKKYGKNLPEFKKEDYIST